VQVQPVVVVTPRVADRTRRLEDLEAHPRLSQRRRSRKPGRGRTDDQDVRLTSISHRANLVVSSRAMKVTFVA